MTGDSMTDDSIHTSSNATPPVIRLHRPDDEHIELYVNEVPVAYANHDEHGWAGMSLITGIAEKLGKALGAPVAESDLYG